MTAQFHEDGFFLRESLLSATETATLRRELETAIEKEVVFHKTREYRDYGMLLAAPIYGGQILQLAENPELFQLPNEILGENCIIHVYTSSSLPPHAQNYSTRIHRERSEKYPDILDFIGMLILLDDFTAENGATWYLPGSHRMTKSPSVASPPKTAKVRPFSLR